MAGRRPGRLLTLLGVFIIVVGLAGALLLVGAASERQANAVEGFARAPVGCDTTLDFVESGEYLVFVERSGSTQAVSGDCDAPSAYDLQGAIDVVVTLVDPDGADIELDRAIGSVDYDIDGYVGQAAFSADIAVAGDHVMRVESDSGSFAVAVGRDPGDGLPELFAAAAAAGVGGVIVGLGMILAGRSRRKSATPRLAPTGPYGAPFSPVGQVPQGPPTYTQPGGPVDYRQPPAPPVAPEFGGHPAAPSWQPDPPSSSPAAAPPPGIPRYEPPPLQAPPSAPPPPPPPPPAQTSVPQIPGEPGWVPPGAQPPPPVAVPVPPDAAERPDLGSDAPWTLPTASGDPVTSTGDSTIQRDEWPARDRSDADDTPTIERRRWDEPPAPN